MNEQMSLPWQGKRKVEPISPEKNRLTMRDLAGKHSPWVILLSIGMFIGAWQLITTWRDYPAFILPGPRLVAERFVRALADGSLLRHSGITLLEVLLGLLAGSVSATALGYLLAKSRLLERLLSPYLVASQAIPIVAIAPLLVIWFGPGMASKVLICALIVFFPVLVNTIVGLRAVPDNLRDLMRSMRATRRQVLRYLEIPAALPIFLGGLRIGATLSVIGAVVGEFVGSDRGLGFLINVGRGQYDTALVFVAIFTLVAMALALYGLVVSLERRLLAWRNASNHFRETL
ncbi:ABC transporter permease [Ornatilinea apprima]|nr:ABC transporter permease [Ornatilinea apprima]